jgi:hypothetical protein
MCTIALHVFRDEAGMHVEAGWSYGHKVFAVAQAGVSGLKTKAFTLSKGVMVDMSLKGTSVETDQEDIQACYGPQVTPSEILNGSVAPPVEAVLLYNTITEIVQSFKGTAAGATPLLAGASGAGSSAAVTVSAA